MNLSSSTYVRNTDAFSVIQKDVATGRSKYNHLFKIIAKNTHTHANTVINNIFVILIVLKGVIGNTQKSQNKIQSLAKLIGNKNAFD